VPNHQVCILNLSSDKKRPQEPGPVACLDKKALSPQKEQAAGEELRQPFHIFGKLEPDTKQPVHFPGSLVHGLAANNPAKIRMPGQEKAWDILRRPLNERL
jgi:hypothetical protein